MIPDDPEKAIRFVGAFLPGFLAIGLASYLVDLRFGEFWYAFISIALSTVSFSLAALVTLPIRLRAQLSLSAIASAKMAASYVIAMILGLAVSVAYDRDWLITAVDQFRISKISKVSQDKPLQFILKNALRCTSIRPLDARVNKTLVYAKAMLRVHIKDYGAVEGFVKVYPTGLDSDQVLLSPACTLDGKTTKAIPGPGVFVRTENVVAWELIDATASNCWKIHFGETLPCLCPSEEVANYYMAEMNRGRPEQSKYKLCGVNQ